MRTSRIAATALCTMVAAALPASAAQALKRCVSAPKPALTNGHRNEKVPLRLEPRKRSRALTRLRSGTEVWIETEPRQSRICPTNGFYPVFYEDKATYEEIWGWVRGSELR